MREQRRVVFVGRVQGVGFRYAVSQAAGRLASGDVDRDPTGYVRNLPTGDVELVVEAPAATIDELLADIRERMAGHIRDEKVDRRPATGDYARFEIRY